MFLLFRCNFVTVYKWLLLGTLSEDTTTATTRIFAASITPLGRRLVFLIFIFIFKNCKKTIVILLFSLSVLFRKRIVCEGTASLGIFIKSGHHVIYCLESFARDIYVGVCSLRFIGAYESLLFWNILSIILQGCWFNYIASTHGLNISLCFIRVCDRFFLLSGHASTSGWWTTSFKLYNNCAIFIVHRLINIYQVKVCWGLEV